MAAMNEMTTPSKMRPYLPVEDIPQNHQTLLAVDEQLKIKSELIVTRICQEAGGPESLTATMRGGESFR